MKKTALFTLILWAFFFVSCNGDEAKPGKKNKLKGLSNQVILDWNQITLEALGGPTYQHSLLGAHIHAMTHIAMHDAINAISADYQMYAFNGTDSQADPVAAAASAAREVLAASFPDKQSMLDERFAQSVVGVKEGDSKTRGIALGKQAAQAVLALRANDGAFQDPIGPVNNPQEPGLYQVVPPFNFVFAPHWKTMKPFALESYDQFRSEPRPALNSTAYAQAFEEVKSVGKLNSTTRTAAQTFYAKFWYEFSEIGWNRVARSALVTKKLDLLETARLFALLNMALADSYTAGWDSKFHYDFWRPFTAIRAAETDGNNATVADPTWEPLMPTPPVQDYPSTHSALGNAGAAVLGEILGDKTSFTMTSTTSDPANVTRSFKSFSQAANENADSRVMVGIHFRFSCEAGQKLGDKVGNWTVKNHLLPLSAAK
ncbi:vanadium-dependent haloperoxidase [Rhodocytophaga rosea]|nr:vanadium-dependent haloperoxidase [Rhodocytophaga rosea]